MRTHFSRTRTAVYWSVLIYSIVFLPFCIWLNVSESRGGCMGGDALGLIIFCVFCTLFVSAVGLIDTIVLIFRGVWDRISPSFFFRAFQINLGLVVLMWFITMVCVKG